MSLSSFRSGGLAPRPVAFFRCARPAAGHDHDLHTKASLAKALATLLKTEYAGEFDAASPPPRPCYLVPSHTLVGTEEALRLGVDGPDDFFGGRVPFGFVADKTITHPLTDHEAVAPAGWAHALGAHLAPVVLPGWSAFSIGDALRAGEHLLAHGSLRLKRAAGVGGAGQAVVTGLAALAARLDDIGEEAVRRDGVVLETNLRQVVTHSVGQVRVGPWVASYVGTQRQVRNPRGHAVYGGSDLTVVRGDYAALQRLGLGDPVRQAIEQALAYEARVAAWYPGFVASRRNYDVAQGLDDHDRWRSGVLEQSWRIGGASGAEIAALLAFQADQELDVVQASTTEVYGEATLPDGATLLFDGLDEHGGRLVKYCEARPYRP